VSDLSAPGVIAIVRLRSASPSDELFEALLEGGISCVEITLPTPDSAAAIARWRSRGGALVGAGTVRTPDDVARAADSGAQFLVTPGFSREVLAAAQARDLPVVCGALTPTEIESAAAAGAACVKVFPVDAVGGPSYIAAVTAPLTDIRLVPTGGVDADAARRYGELGCAGVGVGSSLVDEATVTAAGWETIRARAGELVTAWDSGKASR
jgi:2-dehydro-3-deoxyphosphogluconate aldolase/(4S)-4-hydroxy-2-oxoglutarate aldolase